MPQHPVFSEDMQEIVESFVAETQDILDGLYEDLLALELAADAERIDSVFRAVHTVKGTSSFLGLDQLNALAHHFEDVLNRLRRGDVAFRPEMMDVLFASFDHMAALLQQVLDREITPLPLENLYRALSALCEPAASGDGAVREPALTQELPAGLTKSPAEPQAIRARPRSGSIRVDPDRLEALMDLAGEMTAHGKALTRLAGDLKAIHGETPVLHNLADHTNHVERLAREIRTVVRSTRVVEVDRIFSKFPRVARDLGESLNKDVRIACTGAQTRIDRSQADDVGEALLHLIRNAVDHGIEPRDQRRAQGKPEAGTITLSAERQPGRIVISVADDGCGLDPDAMRPRAAALGFLSEEEAASLPDSRICDLIWEPGFSTTDVANRMSGRGVGMDVVRTMVSRAGGSVEVRSIPGRGMSVTLSLPSCMPHCVSG